MAEMWLDNPQRIGRARVRRPRVTIHGGTVTFGKRSPWKGRVRRANPAPGGVLMLANKKHRPGRGRMPAALARYWATHRRPRRNDPNPRRRRAVSRRAVAVARRHYRRNPRSVRGFLPSMSGWTSYGMTALGMVAPSLVTDRLLPMLGISLTGWLRRGVQLAVPVAVGQFAPRLLGKDTPAFIAGAYGVVVLGVVNDLTGGTPGMVGRYERVPLRANLGRYQRIPAGASAALMGG